MNASKCQVSEAAASGTVAIGIGLTCMIGNRAFLYLIALATGILFCVHLSRADENDHLTDETTVSVGFTGCTNVEDSMRVVTLLLLEKDGKAAVKFLEPREKLGWCRSVEKNTRVSVEMRLPNNNVRLEGYGNWYCVRPGGDPQCYWALGLAVFPQAY